VSYIVAFALSHSVGYLAPESSTDPPAVPPAKQISDVFGKRRPLGRCGKESIESDTCKLQGCGWLRVGRAMSIVVYNCVIIDGEDDGSLWWMRSKAVVNCRLVSFKERTSSEQV